MCAWREAMPIARLERVCGRQGMLGWVCLGSASEWQGKNNAGEVKAWTLKGMIFAEKGKSMRAVMVSAMKMEL